MGGLVYTFRIDVFAYQHGIYPRSEQVVAATRGIDRGRVGADAVEHAFTDDLAAFIRVQRNAGMDFFSDGLLTWQDIFRPLTKALGVKPHTLVRWFDTNTFFREPELSGRLATASQPDGLVPDASVRVLLLDFDTLPTKTADILPILRFRLRKLVLSASERGRIRGSGRPRRG